jgi:alcohol dehydrogenase (NADP+)
VDLTSEARLRLWLCEACQREDIHPMIETIDISEVGCKQAVEKVKKNDVPYRVTLTGFKKAFGTA